MEPKSTSRPFLSHVLAGLAVAGLLLTGCGDSDDQSSDDTPISLGPEGGEGSTTAGSEPEATTTSGAGTEPPSPADPIVVTGDQEVDVSDATARVECRDGGEVDIVAGAADVTITGRCEDVEIDVSSATITIEAAEDVDIDGSDNTVTIGTIEDLDIEGHRNTVRVDSVREIDLDGNDNDVVVPGSPEVEDEGSGNTVSAPG